VSWQLQGLRQQQRDELLLLLVLLEVQRQSSWRHQVQECFVLPAAACGVLQRCCALPELQCSRGPTASLQG
jgi:hypothetical protein